MDITFLSSHENCLTAVLGTYFIDGHSVTYIFYVQTMQII